MQSVIAYALRIIQSIMYFLTDCLIREITTYFEEKCYTIGASSRLLKNVQSRLSLVCTCRVLCGFDSEKGGLTLSNLSLSYRLDGCHYSSTPTTAYGLTITYRNYIYNQQNRD